MARILKTFIFMTLCLALPQQLWAQALLEDPFQDSYQSGVALIRGWVCQANVIEIQIDNGPRLRAAYGTTREDTRSRCGDDNNGFGLTWNWNLSGDGIHTVQALADGVEFGRATFTVTTVGTEFLTGVQANVTVPNFPQTGKMAELEWQQSKQNFVIRRVTTVGGDCASIQQAANALPSSGGEVIAPAGTYTCATPIVIDRDNVQLRGEGPATLLRLANGANAPVLILGQMVAVPSITRKNIHISDLMIDGNRANQTSECMGGPCGPDHPLRNNGVSIRRCEDCRVERVTVFSARSGGLVSELTCRRLTVRDYTSFDNHFDGLAAYETEDSTFSGINVYNNLAAGFSFDIQFNNNRVSDATISGNGTVGIFMRDSQDNSFSNLQVRDSGQHGIFLAQVDTDATKPAAGNSFNGVVVAGSGGAGLRANDASCVNNLVVGSQFIQNAGGCITEAIPGLVQTFGTICR